MRLISWPAFTMAIALLCAASVYAGQNTKQSNTPSEAETERITVDELKAKIAKNEPVAIIDSRSQSSYGSSDTKIKGAIRVPTDEVQQRLKEIPRDKEIVVYCTWPSEHTSARVAQILLENGYKRVRALKGGWDAWIQAGGQVEPKDNPKQ